MNRTVALVTCDRLPELTADDQLLAAALLQQGVAARPAVWSDGSVDWRAFDAVVFRSCWDYHLRFDEFSAWLDRLAALGTPSLNPLPVARWNAGKRYLLALAEAGVPVVRTVEVPRRDAWTIESLRALAGSPAIVVKPIVSATAWLTWKLDADVTAIPDECLEALRSRACIVQPFVPEIRQGEWSLVFFDRAFSHAVVKRPRPDDFRVQEEYGGTATRAVPPAPVLSAARSVLDAVDGNVTYARVDGVDTAEGFRLLELELLEPTLYLSCEPEAPRRFATAVRRALR